MTTQIINSKKNNDMRIFEKKYNDFRNILQSAIQQLFKPFFERSRIISPNDVCDIVTNYVTNAKHSYVTALTTHHLMKKDMYYKMHPFPKKRKNAPQTSENSTEITDTENTETLMEIHETPEMSEIIKNAPKLITKGAFLKKRVLMNCEVFKKLATVSLNAFYNVLDTTNKPRIIAVDGTTLAFLKNDGIKLKVRDDSYSTASCSCLYDITNDVPIDYFLSNKPEREALKIQLNCIKPNDILVVDRGYYSYDFLKTFEANSVKFVCRVKKDCPFVIANAESLCRGTTVTFNTTVETKQVTLKILRYKQYPEKCDTVESPADIDEKCSKIATLTTERLNYELEISEYNKQHTELTVATKFLTETNKELKKIENPDEDTLNLIAKNKLEIAKNNGVAKGLSDKLTATRTKVSNTKKLIVQTAAADNYDYYILTNTDKTDDELKKIYKDRWEVETHFRFLKMLTNIDQMNAQSSDMIKQNLYVTHLTMIVNSLTRHLMKPFYNTTKYVVNKTALFAYIKQRIFCELFLGTSHSDFFERIALEILEVLRNLVYPPPKKKRFRKRLLARPRLRIFTRKKKVTRRGDGVVQQPAI